MTGQLGEHAPFSSQETQALIERSLAYTIITEIPALFLYNSPIASCVFLLLIFGVSVWNGAGFYIEVFGRK